MSQTLHVDNYRELNVVEISALSVAAATGATTVTVDNAQNMSADSYILLGNKGSEGTELKQILSVATPVVTLSDALELDHNALQAVTILFGNQIRIYRASNTDDSAPADASFSLLTTLDIDPDNATSTYTDPNGSSDYWYKFAYYNETTTDETSLAEVDATRGGGYGDYASIESIRAEAGLSNNRYITDVDIDEKRQAAQAEVNSTLAGVYTIPFTSPIPALIAEITRKLAGGLLLNNDYGTVNTFSTNSGDAKIKWARDQLALLNSKKLVLVDAGGTDTSIPGTGSSFGGWPNATTADADSEDGGAERAIRMGMRF